MDGGGRDDPDARGFGELARELRAGAGADVRADAEEGERLAAQAALRRRTLADVAREAADRGLTVLVECGDRRFAGTVAHATRDLLTLVTVGGDVHVNLAGPVLVRTGEPAMTAAWRPDDDVPSFRARLYQLEMDRTEVDVGVVTAPGELRGRLRAVARDHVLLDIADDRSAVAVGAIAWVRVPEGA